MEKSQKTQKFVCHASIINSNEKIERKSREKQKKIIKFNKFSIQSILWTVIFLSIYFFTPVFGNYSINNFPSQTMAYVEQCNNVTEITGYWNLALHTNLDNYYHDVDKLHESMNHLGTICQNETNNSICTQVLVHFGQKLNSITTMERFIKNEISIRDKRAAEMLILGSVSGATSTMIYNWITNSQKSEYQMELLEKQTSVIDLTEQNLMEFDDTLNTLKIRSTEETWATAWLLSAFQSITETQNKILDKITKNTFKIDANEIPMDILIKNVKIISQKLDHKQQLFGATTMEKAMNIYKLASLSDIVVVKNSIISVIKIPIINENHFNCYKITPISFKRSQSTEIISINGQYVLFNPNTNEYCIKNDHEMKKCTRLNKMSFCEINKTTEKKQSDICELEIAINKWSSGCITLNYERSEFLEKLRSATWLFNMNNATAIDKDAKIKRTQNH